MTEQAEQISGVRQKAENDLVLSFLAVRRAIGRLGVFLPVSLMTYALIVPEGALESMSAYYYSPMREVFVGALCALAVFLWSYEGYRPYDGQWLTDRNVARSAAIGATGVAFLPTTPERVYDEAGNVVTQAPLTECTLLQCRLGLETSGTLHFLAAGMFFISLAVFCLFLFTRGDDSDPGKRAENVIYRICGWTILAMIAAIAVLQITGLRRVWADWNPVFWAEVVASLAISVSWMVKGKSFKPLTRLIATRRAV